MFSLISLVEIDASFFIGLLLLLEFLVEQVLQDKACGRQDVQNGKPYHDETGDLDS